MPKEKKSLSGFEIETITIDHKVFSRNAIDKMHWSEKGRLKGQYRILIRNQMRLNKIKATEDNMWGGLKQFIDALCTENFIWDDSTTWLNIKEIRQIKAKESKIVVERMVCS